VIVSESKIRRTVRELIKKDMQESKNWGDISYLKKFEFPHCDMSKFDPKFLKVLNLFKSAPKDKNNWKNKSFVTSLADALSSDPDAINETFITLLNGVMIPAIEKIGAMPLGATAICTYLTKLSVIFAKLLNEYQRSNRSDIEYANSSNDADSDLLAKQQYFFNGFIPSIYNSASNVTPSGVKAFPYDVAQMKTKTNSNNLNGFDAVLFMLFIPNTVEGVASDTQDTKEIADYEDFIREFKNQLRINLTTNRSLISAFEYVYSNINGLYNDANYPDTDRVKLVRLQLFLKYLEYNLNELNKLFEKPEAFAEFFFKYGLGRIKEFTK
jgi:hypothetical protein